MAAQPVIAVAARFRAGDTGLDELLAALRGALVYARRPQHPGVFVADLDKGGRWVFVFSTLEGLARHRPARDADGGLDYFSTTGADLLDNLLPRDVGVVLDPGEDHSCALPPPWLDTGRAAADGDQAAPP